MEYSESLKKNRDFKTVYGNGKSRANKYLVMYSDEEWNREEQNWYISVKRLAIALSDTI